MPALPPERPGCPKAPGGHRPLPDPAAIRLCLVPDSAPPYDDEVPAGEPPGRGWWAAANARPAGLGQWADRDRPTDSGRPADRDRPADRYGLADRDRPADSGRPADRDRPADEGRPADGNWAARGGPMPGGPMPSRPV